MPKRRDKNQYANEALERVKAGFRQLPIFERPRSLAIYNYVTASEVDMLKAMAIDPIMGPVLGVKTQLHYRSSGD